VEAILDRQRAIERYLRGESVTAICQSLGYSREWFYKWWKRYASGQATWAEERPRRPQGSPRRMAARLEQTIVTLRRSLERRGLFTGAQAIAWELTDLGMVAPSVRSIHRVLARHHLVHAERTRPVAKGPRYPALDAPHAGAVHQTDFVGPCYLRGAHRFYSLHSVDVATGRCGIQPLPNRSSQPTLDALWAIWHRLGMPEHQQVDNEMVFYGSQAHPRGLGPLIRLCLAHNIEPWFIPPAEPWRNGIIEKFNDLWQQLGPLRTTQRSLATVARASRAFEDRHNARYRYSKLGGRTPNAMLTASAVRLRFPPTPHAPRHPLPRPDTGRYHLVRFVRSNGRIDLFGELLPVPTEAAYTYVRATVDVARQQLSIVLDGRVIDQHKFLLR
jgi:transposase InsO family protein